MGAPGLAFETWDLSNQFPLEAPTLLFVIRSEAEGSAASNPKQRSLRVSSRVLPKPLLLGNEAVRSSPLRVSVPTEARSRGLSSPVNGQVGLEQTALARSANSLVGAFVWGSGAPQTRSAAPLMTKRRVCVSSGNWFEGSQVSKARPGAPIGFTHSILQRAQALSFLSRLGSNKGDPEHSPGERHPSDPSWPGDLIMEVVRYLMSSSSGSRKTSSSISMSRNSFESNTWPQSRHSTYSTSSSRLSVQPVLLGKIVPAGFRLSNLFLCFPCREAKFHRI
jgi:hypothetical protein